MTTIVTSFSPEGKILYGSEFVQGFIDHAPRTWRLHVYVEHPVIDQPHERVWFRNLLAIKPMKDFLDRHAADMRVRGRARNDYNFRYDAWKFCRKVFALADSASPASGAMAWMDADTRWLQGPPDRLIGDLLDGHDVAYLGREHQYSECGFVALRLPVAWPVAYAWRSYYDKDQFLDCREWHDSYLFDLVRVGLEQTPLKFRNLTPGLRGHVWCESPLAPYWDHLKGNRKALGASPERAP
jgi:hypothetical protein